MAFEKDELISTADMNATYTYSETKYLFETNITNTVGTPVIGASPVSVLYRPPISLGDDSETVNTYIPMAPYEVLKINFAYLYASSGSGVTMYYKKLNDTHWEELSTVVPNVSKTIFNDSSEFAQIKIKSIYDDIVGISQLQYWYLLGGHRNPAVEGENIRVLNEARNGYTTGVVTRALANQGRLGV